MDKKDPKYNEYDSSSDTASVASDESLSETSGPNFADFARQLSFSIPNQKSNTSYYVPYEKGAVVAPQSAGTYVFPSTITEKVEAPKTSDITTLFLVDSMNRDRKAFPQPTSLTLKLPRVYKNVKSIQMTQVKLLCSFYYFSESKSNIYLPIIEKGRESITRFNDGFLTKKITIRQGTYGIGDLLSEIQTAMNYTPLFYDFPNGFTDFIKIFTVSGDFSISFNQPGDSYFDRLNSKYIQNPTLALIISYYWGNRYAGLIDYTMDQLKVAYYYPVLYELFLDKTDTTTKPFLKLSVPDTLLGKGETVYSHLIFNMSGINDQVALYLINQNLTVLINGKSILDIYRLNNTFRYSLVNRYQVAYDSNSLQVNFVTTTLNTSLVNLINNTGSAALASILAKNNLTAATYTILQSNVAKATVVYSDMFRFLQSNLTKLLGIPFATYAPQYFNTVANTIYFQDGMNASGIRTGYTLEYLTSGETPLTSTVNSFSDSPGYWPNLVSSMGYVGTDLSTINSPYSLYPYNIYGKNFQFNTLAIDSTNYYFNTNYSSRSVDVMVNILPAQYTIFKFRSPARQTLQVETLPLPYYYRYADYNKGGNYKGVLDLDKENVPQNYFDISYNFVYTSTNKNMDVANYSPKILQPIFGQPFTAAFTTASLLQANSQKNYFNFEFIAPFPPGHTSGYFANNTKITMISMLNATTSTMFSDNFSMFVYHDRGAFMADIAKPRSENPLHYKFSTSVNTSTSDGTISFSTFSGHTYYTIFRSNNLACSNISFAPLIYYNDSTYTSITDNFSTFNPLGNPLSTSNLSTTSYVINYNTDFTRLPFQSSLTGLDPTSSTFNTFLTLRGKPIGYDISGVSNDLTDYVGFISGSPGVDPTSVIRIDPLSYYSFQYISPFNTLQNTYFDSNTSNSILQPITNNTYTFKGTSTSQVKIVHWYSGYSIPVQLDDAFTTFTTISIANTSSITSVVKAFPIDSQNNIKLGRGINAIGFLPNDGLFEVTSFTFKSCIYPTAASSATVEDPNLQIKYVGVFSGLSLVNSINTLDTALAVLKFTRSIPYGPGTAAETPGFGVEFGTWYQFDIDESYVPLSKVLLNGYTPNSNDLISYNSMYYMVPFNSKGESITYSVLSGSILPYPLAQKPSTSVTFFGQTAQAPPGSLEQPQYIIPVVAKDASTAYGPRGSASQTQSQYEQSIPITTPSIGYKEYSYLTTDSNTPFSFPTSYQVPLVSTSLLTYFSEYSDSVYTVNSVYSVSSNASMSFQSASYASSISTLLTRNSSECINYLVNPKPPLQNVPISGNIILFSTFTFRELPGTSYSITPLSFDVNTSMNNLTLWMWGGGGGTWVNKSSIYGGAGAYIKVRIDVETLLNTKTPDAPLGISTLYMVVGKGGNRSNVSTVQTIGSLQSYEQMRYGGGGTSLLGNFIGNDSISLQGGGFSGLFASPNLLTATPLLIVGGGGAAGAKELGGPGGIGFTPLPQDIIPYPFSSASFSGLFYSKRNIQSIQDMFTNPVLLASTIQNVIDGNFLTSWMPSIPAKMNPSNYFPTPNIYSMYITFNQPLTNISKIRFYGPPQGNIKNLITGITVYSGLDRSQVLFSNTSIQPSEFQVIYNGKYNQQIYEIYPTAQAEPNTINSQAWLVGGTHTEPKNSIQYSLDGLTWIPSNNTILNSVTSILYVSRFSRWFSCGLGQEGPAILSSLDGITWTKCRIPEFTGKCFTTLCFGNRMLLAGTDTGQLFVSSDGVIWTLALSRFSKSVVRIRFINGIFWAIGSSDSVVKNSSDGITWKTVGNVGISGLNDIAYGVGRYVIAQNKESAPFTSGLIYSSDGIRWTRTSQVNITDFSGLSIIFANNVFVVSGITSDSSSFIKYSIDGINWLNSNFPVTGAIQMNDVQYVGNHFVCVGKAKDGTGLAGNQVSILKSVDGISWAYSFSGGFDPDISSLVQANTSSYGPITVQPNLSNLYIEIQKETYLQDGPSICEVRVYDSSTPIDVDPYTLIDGDFTTTFFPPEQYTIDVIEYPITLSYSNPAPLINKLILYCPPVASSLFTGIRIDTGSSDYTVYTDYTVTPLSFTFDSSSGLNMYEITFIPALLDVSIINIMLLKSTPGSCQITDISAINNPNSVVELIPAAFVLDLDSRNTNLLGKSVSNIIDGDLQSSWMPLFIPGDSLKLRITFPEKVARINHIQIINGTFPTVLENAITGISVYTDSTKSLLLYSSTTPKFTQYLTYSLVGFDIIPLVGYSSIYIELKKFTPGLPIINEINFFNVGLITETATGYSGGTVITMNRSINALNIYNGGGGSDAHPGYGGTGATSGKYLLGGSPAILVSQQALTNSLNIVNGSGGGGGGYYGGGGGGTLAGNLGGAGGGGAGFIYPSLFTPIDYSVSFPGENTTITNYISPGINEQVNLIDNSFITSTKVPYGQGGNPLVDSGQGGHGLILITYEQSKIIPAAESQTIQPSFIDGSKLSVFQAPVAYNTENRNLTFSYFLDSIQFSNRVGFNWVWYRSYLSLIGITLLPSFIPDTLEPSLRIAQRSFPSLPSFIFIALSNSTLFRVIQDLFTTGITEAKVSTVSSTIQTIFRTYQRYFITRSYTDPLYNDLTEVYCLLDYLQLESNLANPHVNPANPTLDRIFGGVPRFGYWANPFLVSVSYLGFDISQSQLPSPSLSTLVQSSKTVRAVYGLVMEMYYSTGAYTFKDIMAYKPILSDGQLWLNATQFPQAYLSRSLTNSTYLSKNIPVQPYTFKNAITARIPLFKYSVYTSPSSVGSEVINVPIQVLNDFEGKYIFMYSFQNKNIENQSTINITQLPFTSTTLSMNQTSITQQRNSENSILGTLVTEDISTTSQIVSYFGFNGINFNPELRYSPGNNNFYNSFSTSSDIASSNVGKAITDSFGNYFITDNQGSPVLYQNINTKELFPSNLQNSDTSYNSPRYILKQYNSNVVNVNSDILYSKYTNIWHTPCQGVLNTLYGVRLTSPYDFTVLTNFANQIFYPTHKITLTKKGTSLNPIQDITDVQKYPSYQHTQMFFYKNFTSMVKDISGQFAMEKSSNFSKSDMSSGYNYDSYIYNINLTKSIDFNNDNADSFNYLAIRAYSPSETFQSLVRFYLPQRYDFGYISLKDLSNEPQVISTMTNVNPEYRTFLTYFNSIFSTSLIYGASGVPGYSGSTITTRSFGDFLTQFNILNTLNTSNAGIVSTINGQSNAIIANLITGDLQYILPAYLANRNRTTDPVEFNIPFSSCVTPSNASIEQYGIGYNLGFALEDTPFNTIQRATSFFKIFDDYIYLQLNREYGMNKMDVSQQENFAQTRDTTAQSGLYNSKLMLNSFGSFATTFVQSPVTFNPPVGKIDTLSFNWYDANGVLINNNDCDWSGSVQIVEAVTASP